MKWYGFNKGVLYTRPKLHRAAGPFLTVDFVSEHPGVRVRPAPDFESVMRISKSRAYPNTG